MKIKRYFETFATLCMAIGLIMVVIAVILLVCMYGTNLLTTGMDLTILFNYGMFAMIIGWIMIILDGITAFLFDLYSLRKTSK